MKHFRLAGIGSLMTFIVLCVLAPTASADGLPATIQKIKPAIVAVGTYQKLRSPAVVFFGTGFAVSDGLTIITNAHIIRSAQKSGPDDRLGILSGNGNTDEFRPATVVAIDDEHDLARLHIGGTPLPTLTLGSFDTAAEGQHIAFTGFPLAYSLGFHPATHQGIISAITPVTMPTLNSRSLTADVVAQLRRSAFTVLQLDATAYPGNSGSPVYDTESGLVLGIINMVFVKGLKETAITAPSGITYAIPVSHIKDLLTQKP